MIQQESRLKVDNSEAREILIKVLGGSDVNSLTSATLSLQLLKQATPGGAVKKVMLLKLLSFVQNWCSLSRWFIHQV